MTDPHVPAPKDDRISAAKADFKRMILWIALAGIVVTAAALWYLSLFGPPRTHLVVATVAGVFVSVMLGCGLFAAAFYRSEEHTSELQSLMRISYAVFCLKNKKQTYTTYSRNNTQLSE